jgi:hypothetical protein
MASRVLLWAFETLVCLALAAFVLPYITHPLPRENPIVALGINSQFPTLCAVVSICRLLLLAVQKLRGAQNTESIYGLQHGKLHLDTSTAMWMNMGYWKNAKVSTTLSEACSNLLDAVLAEAGFSSETERAEIEKSTRRKKCLIDLGFGCGDQTVYLVGNAFLASDNVDGSLKQHHCVKFDHYVGVTKDPVQARYALERIEQLKRGAELASQKQSPSIHLYCADAADPSSWNAELHASVQTAKDNSEERWVLALDTAYHFSPSRWPMINYVHSELDASFMGFDLCISPTATPSQKIILRVLTTLMGAPWANFVTPKEYGEKLMQVGYRKDTIIVKDISKHVFTPLAAFLEAQDKRLKTLGLGLGSFRIAKTMFAWWGRTGAVRAVIVVARK